MRRGEPDPRGVWRLARLIRRERPDVVQSWLYHADLAATVALALSGRRRRTRLYWNVRCASMEGAKGTLAPPFVRAACVRLSRVPDAVIANSEAGRAFHQSIGYRPRSFRVIGNGIDPEVFRPDPAARTAVRAELGIPDGQPLVGMVARRHPIKDHETFLAALASRPEIEAFLIGAGTDTLPPRPRIHRLGERQDVPRLLAACDALVSTSLSEGFPNAVIEGMAVGLPVLATDAGDSRRIIGDTGFIVPPGDSGAVSTSLGRLFGEPTERRRARGSAARQRAIDLCGLDRMVDAFDAVYRGD